MINIIVEDTKRLFDCFYRIIKATDLFDGFTFPNENELMEDYINAESWFKMLTFKIFTSEPSLESSGSWYKCKC